MKDKFHIEAELVLSSTVSRLERQCFGWANRSSMCFPFVVVSTDYIKSSKRRDEFLRTCPKLVIVDEAHTCAVSQGSRGGKHHRHELLKGLSADPDRNLILVTATPHSGIEASFRSLLSLLDRQLCRSAGRPFRQGQRTQHRRRLAAHLVQRRRADIRSYLDADTPFPDREEKEEAYKLTPEYKTLFDKVLKYVRERIQDTTGDVPKYRQRVRWWASLALLRAIASSPAAAAATLRTKAAGIDTEDEAEADDLGRRSVMDMDIDEEGDITDTVPGADSSVGDNAESSSERRRLREMANLADSLCGAKDAKLKKITTITKSLLKDGFSPIIFCRFIATADTNTLLWNSATASRRWRLNGSRASCRRRSASSA